jgi:hypothetical protein
MPESPSISSWDFWVARRTTEAAARPTGAGADLRSRPSTGNLRLPRRAQRQQAAVAVEELLFRGHPEVVDDSNLANRMGA